MFGSISSAGSSSSAKSRSRAWLRESLHEQAAREARARERRRARLAERSAQGGARRRRWYHGLCTASMDCPVPPAATLATLGRAASLDTTSAAEEDEEEENGEVDVGADLPPTYSQLDLSSARPLSPPPSYSAASPPPSYAPELHIPDYHGSKAPHLPPPPGTPEHTSTHEDQPGV